MNKKSYQDGAFNLSMKETIRGVDSFLNSCIIDNGKAKRIYNQSGKIPPYAKNHFSVYYGVQCFYAQEALQNGHKCNGVYDYNQKKGPKKVGEINEKGIIETKEKLSEDSDYHDEFGYKLNIDFNDYSIRGHAGMIFTDEGYRIFIDENSEINLLKTKLWCLFFGLYEKLIKLENDFFNREIRPYINHSEVRMIYAEGSDGLEIKLIKMTDLLSIYLKGKPLMYFSFLTSNAYFLDDDGIRHNIMDDKYSKEYEELIDSILSKSQNLKLNFKKMFESSFNTFSFTSLKELQQEGKKHK